MIGNDHKDLRKLAARFQGLETATFSADKKQFEGH